MNTNIDHEGLVCLAAELNTLSTKKELTASDVARRSYLQTTISVLKMGGTTLDEINQATANRTALELGKAPTRFNTLRLSARDIAHAKAWRSIVENDGRVNYQDFRDQGIGHVTQSYYNGSNGSLVPTEFLDQVFSEMKWFDPLVDPNVVNYVETSNGRGLEVPYFDDTSNETQANAENEDLSSQETDIANPGAALLAAYPYRSPLWRASIEAFQDLEGTVSLLNVFKRFAAHRVGVAAGHDLMVGTGTNVNGKACPVGLVPQLIASGVSSVVASGSASNDGGSGTGANSIGSQDIADLYFSVNQAYRVQPKAAWLMNDSTLQFLWKLLDKYGRPLIDLQNGQPMLYGKPVHVAPSMDPIGSKGNVVIFGDLSYWMTRCVMDQSYVQMFRQTAGLPEAGKVGFRMYTRYDGALLFSGTTNAPINYLQCHS